MPLSNLEILLEDALKGDNLTNNLSITQFCMLAETHTFDAEDLIKIESISKAKLQEGLKNSSQQCSLANFIIGLIKFYYPEKSSRMDRANSADKFFINSYDFSNGQNAYALIFRARVMRARASSVTLDSIEFETKAFHLKNPLAQFDRGIRLQGSETLALYEQAMDSGYEQATFFKAKLLTYKTPSTLEELKLAKDLYIRSYAWNYGIRSYDATLLKLNTQITLLEEKRLISSTGSAAQKLNSSSQVNSITTPTVDSNFEINTHVSTTQIIPPNANTSLKTLTTISAATQSMSPKVDIISEAKTSLQFTQNTLPNAYSEFTSHKNSKLKVEDLLLALLPPSTKATLKPESQIKATNPSQPTYNIDSLAETQATSQPPTPTVVQTHSQINTLVTTQLTTPVVSKTVSHTGTQATSQPTPLPVFKPEGKTVAQKTFQAKKTAAPKCDNNPIASLTSIARQYPTSTINSQSAFQSNLPFTLTTSVSDNQKKSIVKSPQAYPPSTSRDNKSEPIDQLDFSIKDLLSHKADKQIIKSIQQKIEILKQKHKELSKLAKKYKFQKRFRISRNYENAENALSTIIKKTQDLVASYNTNKVTNIKAFKEESKKLFSNKAFIENIKIIDTHRGAGKFSQMIFDIFAAIITLTISIWRKERFNIFTVSTDTGNKVREVQNTIVCIDDETFRNNSFNF